MSSASQLSREKLKQDTQSFDTSKNEEIENNCVFTLAYYDK